MNTILLKKQKYSLCIGKFWTKTMGVLVFIMILATFKAQAQNQTFCAPATVSNLANPRPTGFSGQWFADASGGTALAPTTALATGTYYAEQNNPLSIATLGSGFRGSTGIAVQADGKIIVADFQNNLVKRMNADGTGIETLGSGFSQPISVTVEASGTILIAEFSSSVIKRMSADGTVITTVASGFNFPGGVTVQSDGKILVANQGANTVVRMNADGTGMVVLGSGFNRPYATVIQLDGKIIVADAGNNVIKRMDADGTNIATLASGFSSPRRIAIQADGKILIADFGNSAIKRMNADGTGIVTLGSGFGNTFGVAFESTGKILVADFSNAAIKRITEESATRTPVNITVNTTPVPTRNMSITGTLCNGATIGTLVSKFNNSTNVKCYAAATGGSPLADTDLIAPVNASVTFYLTQTIDGCESERLAYTAVVNFITPPNAAPNQNFCVGATVADLEATPGTRGNSSACCLNWFTSPSGGSALASSTALISGTYYVGQQDISGCAIERTMVTVTINTENLDSPTVPSPQLYAGTATIANLTTPGNNLQWYENSTARSFLPTTTTLVDGATYYVSQSNACGESPRTAVIVKKISEAAQNLCAPAIVANLVSTVSDGSIASWFTTASGGTVLASTTSLKTGTYYVEQTTPENITTLGSGFDQPAGIVIQPDGKIIVADFANNLVKRMNENGTNIETLGSGFSQPRSVALEADGKILVMEGLDLKRMNADGTNVVVIATGFNAGRGIAVQSDSKILIADQDANSIIRINPDGTGRTILGLGFRFPFGIAVQSDGEILVADMANRVIKKMNGDGTDIVTLATGFGNPSGIAIQPDGKILIADQDRTSIIRINADGTGLVTLGSGLRNPFGVAVDANGKIVVADFNNNAIKRITEESRTNRVAVAVTVNEAPTIPSPQVYAGTAMLANLGDFGNNVRYYENVTGGSALPTTTVLVDGTTYYVSQSDLCGESPRTAVTVKKISEAVQNSCAPAIVSDLLVTPSAGTAVQWFDSSKGTTPLADAAPLAAGTYYVEQVAPAFITTLPVSYNTDGGMALQQDDKIVLADYNSIKRINANGSNLETLLSLPSSYIADVAVQQDGKIIFTDYNAGSIKRINSDGTNLETVISGLVNPTFIAIQSDGKIIFVVDLGIYRVNANGTGLVLLRGGASFGGNITDIVIQQDGKILYPVAGNGAVLRMDADGTNNILFYQEQNSFFYGLSVQNDGKIIATDILNGGRIIRLNADGTNLVTLASNIGGNAYGILAEPNGTILFTDTSTSTPLKRINKGLPSNRVPVTVNITPKTNNVTNIAACGSYYWSVNEQTYTTSGTYTFVNGCATETLNATITTNTESVSVIGECDSYTWPANGETYTKSGTYTFVNGCDTKKLQLTITPTTTNTRTLTACTSFFWTNTGQTYTTTGLYTGRTTNCIKEILDLTIVPSTENTTTLSACGSYIWNGQTYIQSGTYTGITTNCVTEKLVLTIVPSSDNVTTASACGSYTWNGQTYTQSGTYTGITTNCVTEKLVLTIVPNSDNVTTITACDSYTWNGQTYTQSGTYTGTTTNCVTEKLVLTINDPINSSVSLGGDTLKSNASSGTYQWIDCNNSNQPIVGETNQTFTPKQPGSYAVIVTQNSCSVTSNCQVISVLGNDTFEKEELRYFPNPTAGILNVSYSEPMTEIAVMNILGQTVLTLKPNSNEAQLDLSRLPSNTYLIKLTTEGKSKIIRVIKN